MGKHLYGDMLPVRADVCDCVKVKAGDLMIFTTGKANSHEWLNVGIRGGVSGVTRHVYPMAAGVTLSSKYSKVTFPFMGVALDDSPHGSTDTIGVATAGVWEFALATATGVTVGRVIKSVIATGFKNTSSTTASVRVMEQAQTTSGVSIGWCVKTEAKAKTAQFLLRSSFGPGGLIIEAL